MPLDFCSLRLFGHRINNVIIMQIHLFIYFACVALFLNVQTYCPAVKFMIRINWSRSSYDLEEFWGQLRRIFRDKRYQWRSRYNFFLYPVTCHICSDLNLADKLDFFSRLQDFQAATCSVPLKCQRRTSNLRYYTRNSTDKNNPGSVRTFID